jgi:hypothetical protein
MFVRDHPNILSAVTVDIGPGAKRETGGAQPLLRDKPPKPKKPPTPKGKTPPKNAEPSSTDKAFEEAATSKRIATCALTQTAIDKERLTASKAERKAKREYMRHESLEWPSSNEWGRWQLLNLIDLKEKGAVKKIKTTGDRPIDKKDQKTLQFYGSPSDSAAQEILDKYKATILPPESPGGESMDSNDSWYDKGCTFIESKRLVSRLTNNMNRLEGEFKEIAKQQKERRAAQAAKKK